MWASSTTASLAVHALLVALVLSVPAARDLATRGSRQALEIELRRREPEPRTARPEARAPARAPTAAPRAPRAEREPRARAPRPEPEREVRPPSPEPEPAPSTPPTAADTEGERGHTEAPPRFTPFDAVSLAAAIEPPAPTTPGGTTLRGALADQGPGGEIAVDAVRSLTEELREQVLAGRPEARGVATYFQESRRRLAAAWAPRTAHLPGRAKAMIQSMQAVNRAAIDMMEGRSERSRAAQLDGRVTPDEWRDAMREAAQKARAVNSAIVAVVHDETGRVVDVRLTRSSGHDDLDRSVLAAAREGLGQEPAPPMPPDRVASRPGGRVARYRFDVLMTAMPPIPPIVGVTFDESTGMFRVFYPGQVNWRLRVVFLGAHSGMDVRPQSRESE